MEGIRLVDTSQRYSKACVVDHVLYGGRREALVLCGEKLWKNSTISPSGSIDVFITVSTEESSLSKIQLQKRLLFAPLPRIFLEGRIVLKGMQSL